LGRLDNRNSVYGFIANSSHITFFRHSTIGDAGSSSSQLTVAEDAGSDLIQPTVGEDAGSSSIQPTVVEDAGSSSSQSAVLSSKPRRELLELMVSVPISSDVGVANISAFYATLSYVKLSLAPRSALQGVSFNNCLYSGKFSQVYSGVYNNEEVVIKFCENERCFDTEKTILSLLQEKRGAAPASVPLTTTLVTSFDDKKVLVLSPKAKSSCAVPGKGNLLTPEFTADHLQSLFEAIQQLHECDVIHGDLRPANVLIAADDEGLVLADWGFSRVHSTGSRDRSGGSCQTRKSDWKQFVTHFLNQMEKRFNRNKTDFSTLHSDSRLQNIGRAIQLVNTVAKSQSSQS